MSKKCVWQTFKDDGTYGSVSRDGRDVDVVKDDVVGADKEIRPARRVLHMQSANLDVGGIVCEEENGAVKLVVGIEDLSPREAVPPCLAIAVENS